MKRPHLIDGQFQSDKYPTTPRGKVPLSVKDKSAQDLLWEYAQRRRVVDAEFSNDLEIALRIAGYLPRDAAADPRKVEERLVVTDLCDMQAFHREGRLGAVLRRAIDFIEGTPHEWSVEPTVARCPAWSPDGSAQCDNGEGHGPDHENIARGKRWSDSPAVEVTLSTNDDEAMITEVISRIALDGADPEVLLRALIAKARRTSEADSGHGYTCGRAHREGWEDAINHVLAAIAEMESERNGPQLGDVRQEVEALRALPKKPRVLDVKTLHREIGWHIQEACGGLISPGQACARIAMALTNWNARTAEPLPEASDGDEALAEDGRISAALPTQSGRHDLYAEAMRLVGAKHSKGALVALVNWLLLERDGACDVAVEANAELLRRATRITELEKAEALVETWKANDAEYERLYREAKVENEDLGAQLAMAKQRLGVKQSDAPQDRRPQDAASEWIRANGIDDGLDPKDLSSVEESLAEFLERWSASHVSGRQ